jgi:hypothetical protein
MILKIRSICFCYNISYLCTIILSEILKHVQVLLLNMNLKQIQESNKLF